MMSIIVGGAARPMTLEELDRSVIATDEEMCLLP